MKRDDPGKELYRQLRALPWPRLWGEEVPRFDRASPRERLERVAVIRAVGAVFPESGPAGQRGEVRGWLRRLLHDPQEKLRRYAMAALPKIGAEPGDEAELLDLLRGGAREREAKFLRKALDKIGGEATLEALAAGADPSLETEQKVRAGIARTREPASVLLDREIPGAAGLLIHLRGRAGLETIVREEVEARGKLRIAAVEPGLVAVRSPAGLTLADIFDHRCFGTAGLVLGRVDRTAVGAAGFAEAIARVIAAPASQRLLRALTGGPVRYRLEFAGRGHQRGAVRAVVNRAYALCPEILNDPRQAPWSIDIHPAGQMAGAEEVVELRPRLSPDPRHAFRVGDVPAASHPPLAACMARLAGNPEGESVWDPFCGSGLELIERCLAGGVRQIFGSDLSAEAVGIARRNLAAALPGEIPARFERCDFREFPELAGLAPGSLTLMITNPPLGRRVPIHDLRGLFDDLFARAVSLLAPGGRLILTNPFPPGAGSHGLVCDFRQAVDLGGFTCNLERHRKPGPP